MKVSVILPAYNTSAYIGLALESIFAQTVPAHQIIVVNDGSTDNTVAVLEQYKERIIIKNSPNRGVSAARNLGALAADGDALVFLDGDDLLHPEFIERMMGALETNPSAGAATCDASLVRETENGLESFAQLTHSQYVSGLQGLEHGMFVSPGSTIIRREAFAIAGGYDPFFNGSAEDYKLFLCIAGYFDWVFVEGAYFLYRVHPEGQSNRYVANYRNTRILYDALGLFVQKRKLSLSVDRVRASAREHYASRLLMSLKNAASTSQRLQALWTATKFLILYPKMITATIAFLNERRKNKDA